MPFGEVSNLWLRRDENDRYSFFAGHTDGTDGPEEKWVHPPFSGDIVDGMLHGRGAADMKAGSLAAMNVQPVSDLFQLTRSPRLDRLAADK